MCSIPHRDYKHINPLLHALGWADCNICVVLAENLLSIPGLGADSQEDIDGPARHREGNSGRCLAPNDFLEIMEILSEGKHLNALTRF